MSSAPGENKQLHKIKISTYSGHKGNERPLSFTFEGREIKVIELIDAWIEERYSDRMRRRFFVIQGNDGHEYKLLQDVRSGEWYLSQ
jgi:hypothetical protein